MLFGHELAIGTVVAFGVFPLFMIVATALDIATMTISNRLCAALAAAFVPAALVAGFDASTFGLHLAIGFGALAVGFAMFAAGWVGGGDAKFLAATALWMGWPNVVAFALMVALSGGGLAVALLTARRIPLPAVFLRHDWIVRLHLRESGIPYAAAFAAGALIVFPDTQLFAALLTH